jgi:hypothetical protein
VAALLASSECTRSLVERFEFKCRFVVRIGCFPPVPDSPVADLHLNDPLVADEEDWCAVNDADESGIDAALRAAASQSSSCGNWSPQASGNSSAKRSPRDSSAPSGGERFEGERPPRIRQGAPFERDRRLREVQLHLREPDDPAGYEVDCLPDELEGKT